MSDDDEIRMLKAALVRGIIFATEAAGLWDQLKFLRSIGTRENWLDSAVRDGVTVPLEEYVHVYNAAAEAAGWKSASQIFRSVTDYQRFKEWPE